MTLLLMLNKYPVFLSLFTHIHSKCQIQIHFLMFITSLLLSWYKFTGGLTKNCIIGLILSWQKESCSYKYSCSIYVLSSYIVIAGVPWRKPEPYGLWFKNVSHCVEMNLESLQYEWILSISTYKQKFLFIYRFGSLSRYSFVFF